MPQYLLNKAGVVVHGGIRGFVTSSCEEGERGGERRRERGGERGRERGGNNRNWPRTL